MRCRDDLRCARTAARHRVAKQLLRHGRIYREGKTVLDASSTARGSRASGSTIRSRSARWSRCSSISTASTRQLAALEHELEQIATRERWADQVALAVRFRGIATLTALGLIAEIGDFAPLRPPARAVTWLGLTASEYSSGDQPAPRPHHQGRQPPRPPAADRGRLALPTHHAPRAPPRSPSTSRAAPSAPGRPRSACTTATATSPSHGKRSTVANVAVARELAGFLWAAMTDQPLRDQTAAA